MATWCPNLARVPLRWPQGQGWGWSWALPPGVDTTDVSAVQKPEPWDPALTADTKEGAVGPGVPELVFRLGRQMAASEMESPARGAGDRGAGGHTELCEAEAGVQGADEGSGSPWSQCRDCPSEGGSAVTADGGRAGSTLTRGGHFAERPAQLFGGAAPSLRPCPSRPPSCHQAGPTCLAAAVSRLG